MVTLRYGFDNPKTIISTHRYLYHDKRFHSFEEAREFIKDLPSVITLKVIDWGQEFVTELETNCYILCEGRKIPQIKGKFYEIFEYYGCSNFEEKFQEIRDIDYDLRYNKCEYNNENIKEFLDKFIKR